MHANWKIIQDEAVDDNFKILNQTSKYVLGHIFEEVYLIEKVTNDRYRLGSMYADPSCGLIDKDNKWCIVCGSTIIIWAVKETTELNISELNQTCRIRQSHEHGVQILIDPWADNSSIWELNILDKTYFKLCDFKNYQDKTYTEEIEW